MIIRSEFAVKTEEMQHHTLFRIGENISGKKIEGELNMWEAPVIDIIVGNGKNYTEVKALIDTGAYHNHVNSKIAKQFESILRGKEIHRTPYGSFELSVYTLIFGFKNFPETQFVCDTRTIDYECSDFIIGSKFIAEFCDLHIYGSESRFELVFR